ncbi:multicopper oxidase domain-containing protein [Streptosporangium sp. DT93]|uniref:multicopper oxidase domain-containing protein n=1 Tax=Streptosporangium sp. DT93 TaxID=3393428 RepID=UPI003CE7B72C
MFEPLFLTDMLLALAVMVAAAFLGRSTGRWVLYGTAVLVAARLVVAALLMTGGPQLAGTRLLLQLPLAVLPLTAAFVRPGARRPAAVGVALSAVWLFVPYAQAEALLTLAVSAVVMGATWALGHRRGPWATLGFVAAPAVVLFLAFQGNVASSGHHDAATASGGPAVAPEAGDGPLFDALTYGTAEPAEPVAYDRAYDVVLDDGFGFAQGSFTYVSSSINGRLYSAVPTLTVAEGERVKVRIVNRSLIDHPMHLHGHRVRVLSRNGAPAAGTWRTDSLNVAPGQIFEVDLTADNPGIWMDHCHNFKHGAEGMIMHLAYTGVTSPFRSAHIPE